LDVIAVYYPYFRGKQFELLTIRETAPILAASKFQPIIEPVREGLSALQKTLKAVVDAKGKAIVIVNPYHGDLSGASEPLTELLRQEFSETQNVSAGILLGPDTKLKDALELYEQHGAHNPSLIHFGFNSPKSLVEHLKIPMQKQSHVFYEKHCGKLYQKHFSGAKRVLLRDGFKRKERNKDYPHVEHFSDLHATFLDEAMNGFGDFLIVGDGYTESGGPAFTVAIHLTFIDHEKDESMFIYHFKSERQDTPKDPAGKFAEALAMMMKTLNSKNSKVLETDAVSEFRLLHGQGHFPGLGHIKKLSMNHHIETLATFFNKAS
jgi:hypothetical protein